MLMEPLADVDVNVPGVMVTLAAPEVVQVRVLLAPELMAVGFAKKEDIFGSAPLVEDEFEVELQLISAAEERRITASKQKCKRG